MIHFIKMAGNMPRSVSLLTLWAVIGLITVSCSNSRPVYQGAEYYKNLEVPPDLTEPDKADEVIVPKPTNDALERFRDNNKLDTVLTPKFDGVRTVSYAGNSWIEVDNNADKVWPRLLEFWETEGFKMAQVRPELGFMETDWEERLAGGGSANYILSLLQKIDADEKDKFRVRIERFENNTKTRLFISNSRIERIVSGEYGDDVSWRYLPSSLPAEREIIARMARFAGLQQSETLALLENYRPYASLVKLDSTDNVALYMKGSMDFVWRRSMRALNRMRMQDIVQNRENSRIDFAVGKISEEDLQLEEDELTKSSWIMRLFSGDSDSGEMIADGEGRQYQLVLSIEDDFVKIEVKDAGDSQTLDDDGDTGGTVLAEQLRNLLVKRLE